MCMLLILFLIICSLKWVFFSEYTFFGRQDSLDMAELLAHGPLSFPIDFCFHFCFPAQFLIVQRARAQRPGWLVLTITPGDSMSTSLHLSEGLNFYFLLPEPLRISLILHGHLLSPTVPGTPYYPRSHLPVFPLPSPTTNGKSV